MSYEVHIDTAECVSAGKCVATAPGFFVFDDEEIAAIEPSVEQPDDITLLRIARQCPSGAIRLTLAGEPVEV